jgi:crossover junction endodeoxyribonuclease RuvC
MNMWNTQKNAAVIGIDPGLKGGIAILPVHSMRAARAFPMPLVGDKKNVDWQGVGDLLRPWVGPVYIEKVHAMPKQGVSSTFKFGASFGGLLGVCGALKRPVALVTPQKWKKSVLSAYEDRDKAAAIDYTGSKFPWVSLTPGRTRTPQDGLADALCIAVYGVSQEDILND